MSESTTVKQFLSMQDKARQLGLDLDFFNDEFSFKHVPGSNGLVGFKTIKEMEIFLRGYELGLNQFKNQQAQGLDDFKQFDSLGLGCL